MNVQYGCGLSCPDNWLNFDTSPTLQAQKIPLLGRYITRGRVVFPDAVQYGDIVKGLPVKDASCDVLYCSHVLEHLSLNDLRIALRNSYRLLKPNGVFRLVMPDFEFFIKEYLSNESSDSVIQFFRHTSLGLVERKKGILNAIHANFENSRHFWLWDYKGIEMELRNVGFSKIRRAYFGDSANKVFSIIESKERWEQALGVECFRE